LRASGTRSTLADFVLGVIWDLLPEGAYDIMIANAEAEGNCCRSKTMNPAYLAPLRQALIDDNSGHVNLVVCESDYRALKRGIEHLPPMVQ
jgi:hypothetical protein